MKLTHSNSRIFIDDKDITTDFILTAVEFFKENTVQEFGYNGECTNLIINVKDDKESIERLILMLNEKIKLNKMDESNNNHETANGTNPVLADSLPLFTMDEVGRMIYEFMGQYHLEGKYNHCQHTIDAIQEYKQDKLMKLKR